MKTSLLILLALFTLCSCKFSFDKAKVEESYGNYDGGAGGGGSTCPTNDPDPSYSTLSVDSTKLADGIEEATLTYTLLDCNSQPIIGFTPVFTATDTSSLNTQTACTASDSSGISTCTLKSEYAETKTITTTNIALAGATIEFTVPPLTLNLTACLASTYDISTPGKIMSTPSVFNTNRSLYSPYVGSSWYTNNESAVLYSSTGFGTVIDWVLVQVYTDEVLPTPLAAKSAVLHDDGSITEPGASAGSGLSLNSGLSNDYNANYKINVIHRNHLSVALDSSINRTTSTIDLTSTTTIYRGETGGLPSEEPFVMMGAKKCLRPGDFNNDFQVNGADKIGLDDFLFGATGLFPGFSYTSTQIMIPGYYPSDLTMNGYSYLWSTGLAAWADDAKAVDDHTMTGSPTPIWGDGI